MNFLSQLSVVDMATLTMSAVGLIGGIMSTLITMNASIMRISVNCAWASATSRRRFWLCAPRTNC